LRSVEGELKRSWRTDGSYENGTSSTTNVADVSVAVVLGFVDP